MIQSSGIFRVQTTCPSCHGAGSTIEHPCGGCHGAGYTLRKVRREVQIPAGIDDSMRVRLPGEGRAQPQRRSAGRLLRLRDGQGPSAVRPRRAESDRPRPIGVCSGGAGGTLEVPTLEGREELKIPAGTQSGEVLKLRGRGIPHPRGRQVGDLLVQVVIDVPKHLTARQKELLRELAELEHAHVTPPRKSFFEKVRELFVPSDSTQTED